jgi:hypothetical protein
VKTGAAQTAALARSGHSRSSPSSQLCPKRKCLPYRQLRSAEARVWETRSTM